MNESESPKPEVEDIAYWKNQARIEQGKKVVAQLKLAFSRISRFQQTSFRNRKNAKKERPDARKIDHDEVRREFKKLVNEGFTEREARGILVQRGLGSQPQIYRITIKPFTTGR